MDKEFEDKLRMHLKRCLNAKYIHVEEGSGDYAVEESEDGRTLYLMFQWTQGSEDWKNNFDFPAKPYKDMDVSWMAHGGFLKTWKSIEPYIEPYVKNDKYTHICIIGFSQGAAIATFAHEYVWYHRPDLRPENCGYDLTIGIEGYGFGCPRVFWGRMKKELKMRWLTFFPIRNLNDIVTHVPPVLFGFKHVASVLKIGKKGALVRYRRLDCVSAHYPQNYDLSLGGYKE